MELFLKLQKMNPKLAENTKCKDISNLFTNTAAVAMSEDAITSAKILTKFSKERKQMILVGSWVKIFGCCRCTNSNFTNFRRSKAKL